MAASRFQKAVDDSETLGECYRKGLGALSKKERALIEVANTRKLQGSVNLDRCLETLVPHAPRWDYAIGYASGDGEKVYYVEIHPAATSHVEEVIRKHAWLIKWLKEEAAALHALPKSFWWVATNAVDKRILAKRSRYRRRLSQHGIMGPTERLTLR